MLCEAMFERFDRDQYHLQLQHLDVLRQIGSVAEYLEKFEELAHGVLLYNTAYDDTYFVTWFIGGLKKKFRSPLLYTDLAMFWKHLGWLLCRKRF